MEFAKKHQVEKVLDSYDELAKDVEVEVSTGNLIKHPLICIPGSLCGCDSTGSQGDGQADAEQQEGRAL